MPSRNLKQSGEVDLRIVALPRAGLDAIEHLPGEVLERGFIRCEFSRKSLRKDLGRVDADACRALGWRWNDSRALGKLAANFAIPEGDEGAVGLEICTGRNTAMKEENVVLFGIFRHIETQIPAGCFNATFYDNKNGERVCNIGNVYTDRKILRGHGYAVGLLALLQDEVHPVMRTQVEELKADFCGRYVWAQCGFQFQPKYWLKDVGQTEGTISYLEAAKRNFLRFLAGNKLAVSSLIFERNTKELGLRTIDDLESPADFASLRDSRGRTIRTTALIDAGTLSEPRQMEVGKAFMLGSYAPGRRYITSMARTKFSDRAMPYYNAYRRVS